MKLIPGVELGIMIVKSVQYDTNPATTNYRTGDSVGFSSPKWSWREEEVFTTVTDKSKTVTHVFIGYKYYPLGGEFVLNEVQITDLPKEAQDEYLKCLQEYETRQKTKNEVYAIITEEVMTILDKYPTAYLYSGGGWNDEIVWPLENISKAEYIKYVYDIDNDKSFAISLDNRFDGLFYNRECDSVFNQFEKTLLSVKRFRTDLPLIEAKYSDNWKENGYIYFNIDNVTIRIHDHYSYYIDHSIEYVLISKLESEKQSRAKVQAYEDKQKRERETRFAAINNKNEALCKLVLKKFPKAQIIKIEGREWCVNSNKVTLSNFCKQNNILIPKNLK